MAKKSAQSNNHTHGIEKLKPEYNASLRTTSQIESDFKNPRSSLSKRNDIIKGIMYYLFEYRMQTNPDTATLHRIVDFQYLLKELPKKLHSVTPMPPNSSKMTEYQAHKPQIKTVHEISFVPVVEISNNSDKETQITLLICKKNMGTSKQIITILKRLKSLKARDIAMELSKLNNRCYTKQTVNEILNKDINQIVEHDTYFYWRLKPDFDQVQYAIVESDSDTNTNSVNVRELTIDVNDGHESCNNEILPFADNPTSLETNITEEVVRLNTENIISIVGIARKLKKPTSVIYKLLRENGLLKTNPEDTLWYKEVSLPAELRILLKQQHITFGLWCSSLRVSPIAFGKLIESRLEGNLELTDIEYAFNALTTDFPEVFGPMKNSFGQSDDTTGLLNSIFDVVVSSEKITTQPNIKSVNDEIIKSNDDSTSNLLLNDHDCQIYIMARYAGEAFGSYSLWTPSMEYKWYQWLENSLNAELRESFYFIAMPEEWPVNNKAAQELKYKIDELADTDYFLREPKYSDGTLPQIQNLYLLICYVMDHGSINWIAGNRILGRKIDDYNTAIEMAFLVCLGVVEPAYNWQRQHIAKCDAKEIAYNLSNMLQSDEGKTWNSRAGEFLLDTFTININTCDMGWVTISSVNKLFHDASKGKTELISEEILFSANPTQKDNVQHKNINKVISDPSELSGNAGSLLLALKNALNPIDIISDELWFEWSQYLVTHPIYNQFIFTVAEQNDFSWPVAKQFECFDKYLGLPLNTIFKMLGWKNSRTLLLCVAITALNKQSETRFVNIINIEEPEPVVSATKNYEISFEVLYRSDDPISLLTDEIWDGWTSLLLEDAARSLLISDIVDDLGSLYWQARWKDEKIANYCRYSLDEIRDLKYPGKNRTVVICLAKVASDVISKSVAETSKDRSNYKRISSKNSEIFSKSYSSKKQTELEFVTKNKGNILDSIIEDFF